MNYKIFNFFLWLVTITSFHELTQANQVAIIDDIDDGINDILFEAPIKESEDNKIVQEFNEQRESIIEAEELIATGGHLQLSADELKANEIFMGHKLRELSQGFENPENFAAAKHFFQSKDLIDQSYVFKILQQMPKGANLHVHNTAAVSSEWVVANLTYMPGLMRCINQNNLPIYTFRKNPEKHMCSSSGYVNVAEERAKAISQAEFDKDLEKDLNLYTSQPETEYNHIEKVWTKFQNMFDTIGDIVSYHPAYRVFHWRMLEELYEDNVMYTEIRTKFKSLYGDNGTSITAKSAIELLHKVVEEFKATHPGFIGIKIIWATARNADKKKILEQFEEFKRWHALYPNFIVGFDLVGQEDKGKSLHTFIDVLKDMPKTASFFFHAGETNWYNTASDLNLVDAILMNTKRIGHGYALLKHPKLQEKIKNLGIAIEVTPISNQVLHLVWDMRNHPAAFFLSQNLPMVIANDDPGFWNAKGLSYDMYYTAMSLMPNNAGLKTLKHIIWSSIKYSALNEQEREYAYELLARQWKDFVVRLISSTNNF